MKYYATDIRKINEDNLLKQRNRKTKYTLIQPNPSHYEKYRKFMDML